MKATESKSSFEKRLSGPVDQLTPRAGVAAMCSFYADERADRAATGNDRDMLLYQWGVDTFNAPGVFEFSIARQINVKGESQPYHLALRFSFPAAGAFQKIDFGNQWCPTPADLPAFQRYIESSPAFAAVADSKADRIELQLERRG